MARQKPSVRRAVTEGLLALVSRLAPLLPGRSKAEKRQAALAAFAGMVGAVMMARAVDDAELSEEILQAVARSLPRGH